jgi:hypothetical protein
MKTEVVLLCWDKYAVGDNFHILLFFNYSPSSILSSVVRKTETANSKLTAKNTRCFQEIEKCAENSNKWLTKPDTVLETQEEMAHSQITTDGTDFVSLNMT